MKRYRQIRVEEHEDGLSRRVTLLEGAGQGEDWGVLAELNDWVDTVHLNSDGSVTMNFRESLDVLVLQVENTIVTRDLGGNEPA